MKRRERGYWKGQVRKKPAELFPGNEAVVGEGAVDNKKPDRLLVGRGRNQMDGNGASQALTQHRDPLRVHTRQGEEGRKGRLGIPMDPVDGRRPLGEAVATIVDDENRKPLFDQPENAVHVGADVFGITMEDENAPPRLAGGAKEPTVQPDTIGCAE